MSDEMSKPASHEAPPHDHADGAHCTAPGPWFTFGLTAAMAGVLAAIAYLARVLIG